MQRMRLARGPQTWRDLRSCRALLLCTVMPMAACTVGPDFEKPASWYNPASWFNHATPKVAVSQPVAEPVDPAWWTLFHDPELTSLEQRVADSNLDVRVAAVRLVESRASLGIARADAFPQLNGNSSYTREQTSKKGVISLFSPGGGGTPGAASNGLAGRQGGVRNNSLVNPYDLYQYGFDASWELDLWGRVRRNVESSQAQLTEQEEQQRDTQLTSLAELARDYIQLRGVQANIATTQRNLETAQQSLKLTQDRAAGGLTTDLDVANAAAQVATTAAQLPNLQQQAEQYINAISLLLGEPPAALQGELAKPGAIPPVPPRVPVGMPSELARRRPDIRKAEATLHAATADVGVAVADFYPRVTLSGSFALQATQFHNLGSWDSNSYSFGPSITLPIFQGGRLTRTLDLRRAQEQEAAITYQRTVLGALHEVDNALTAYDAEQRRRSQLEQAVVQNRRALDLARQRYEQGIADFLQVLDAQRSLLSAEQQFTDSTTTVSTNLVQIYKALGGGWENDFPEQQAKI